MSLGTFRSFTWTAGLVAVSPLPVRRFLWGWCWWCEHRGQLGVIAGLGHDQDVVAGEQGGVRADGQELLVTDHEADPEVAG